MGSIEATSPSMKKLFILLTLAAGCGTPLVTGIQAGEVITVQRADGTTWSAFENRQRGARRIWVGPKGQEKPVTEGPYTDQDPSLIEHNGELLLAFASNRSGKWQVYVTRSQDGRHWSQAEAIGEGLAPQVLADTRHVAVTYEAWGGGVFVRDLAWKEAKSVHNLGRFPKLAKLGDFYQLNFHTSADQTVTLVSRDLESWAPGL